MSDSLDFDTVIVGAGPAGLSAAIRLAQLNPSLRIAVLEKGAQVGSHLISGALFDPSVLNTLLPNWRDDAAFSLTPITQERFLYLSKQRAFPLPTPKRLKHADSGIISIGQLCRYLARTAEQLGVSIFPGFPAHQLHWNADKTRVTGVISGGTPIQAKHTLLAEGCRGFLSEQAIAAFSLRQNSDTQRYALGVKEKWRINPSLHQAGKVIHTVGWPLHNSSGGGFLYHADTNTVSIGVIASLNYRDPAFSPFEQLQRFKTHPAHKHLFESGECIGYGARAINQGGWQSIPRCDFPGGYLIGCSAGFVDNALLQGIHHAMQTGILCAEHALSDTPQDFTDCIKHSPTGSALYRSRNIKPSYRLGNALGLLSIAMDQWVFQGRAPWTLTLPPPDHTTLRPTTNSTPSWTPDRRVTFDRLTQLRLSNTHHPEGQSAHLQVNNRELTIKINYQQFGGPETRYCPAHVYEYSDQDTHPRLQINAQNCLHCKTCSIKDPMQNIEWTAPIHGGGPNYIDM